MKQVVVYILRTELKELAKNLLLMVSPENEVIRIRGAGMWRRIYLFLLGFNWIIDPLPPGCVRVMNVRDEQSFCRAGTTAAGRAASLQFFKSR